MTAEDHTTDESTPPDPDSTDRITAVQQVIDSYLSGWPSEDPDSSTQESD